MCVSRQTQELTVQVLLSSSILVQMLHDFLSSQPNQQKANVTKAVSTVYTLLMALHELKEMLSSNSQAISNNYTKHNQTFVQELSETLDRTSETQFQRKDTIIASLLIRAIIHCDSPAHITIKAKMAQSRGKELFSRNLRRYCENIVDTTVQAPRKSCRNVHLSHRILIGQEIDRKQSKIDSL